jgi:hypothetical protein
MPFAGEDAMKNVSKEKQTQLVLAVVVILLVLCGLYFGLISFQLRSLHRVQEQAVGTHHKVEQIEQALKMAAQVEQQLADTRAQVAQLESGMASGDLYSWFIETIRQFKLSYHVDIPQFSQVDGPKEMTLMPSFPYKQATLSVGGTAFWEDLGHFIADFENQFPFARITNLSVEPASGGAAMEPEKLSFKMDIIVLVKPATT